jgi:hypothetical protein
MSPPTNNWRYGLTEHRFMRKSYGHHTTWNVKTNNSFKPVINTVMKMNIAHLTLSYKLPINIYWLLIYNYILISFTKRIKHPNVFCTLLNNNRLKIIFNMYQNSKSCLFYDGNKSEYFPCEIGSDKGKIYLISILFIFTWLGRLFLACKCSGTEFYF